MASSDLSCISAGDIHHLSDMNIVLLGCRNSGKISARNTILGKDALDIQESTQCVKSHGKVAGRTITLVEAPGWCSDTSVVESTDLLKEEIVCSVSQCPPGPHAVLVVVNSERMFTEKDRELLAGYMNIFGDQVWSHAIVLFTVGDSLGDRTIETHIESEGEALQWLVEKCGHRYHVFKEMMDDDSQVMELLEKIEKMVAGNRGCHLVMGTKIEVDGSWRKEEEKLKERQTKEHFREETRGTEKGSQSTSTLHPDAGHASVTAELFTPELIENSNEDRSKDEYRFLCPHSGQFKCKFTDLIFDMEGKGEVLYSIVSWDRQDNLCQKEPAGPLYSINCLEGSIRHLHLPHCEIRWDCRVDYLTAAHVAGGNVKVVEPLKVTNTHVTVNFQRLSFIGLLKSLEFQQYPIKAQVILFCKETGEDKMRKLLMHLLPGNVPTEAVQKQYNCNTFIETTSNCQLTPGKIYRASCKTADKEYMWQPQDKKFKCDHGPNYRPVFEVLFDTEVDNLTLRLLDENDQEVWTLLSGPLKGATVDHEVKLQHLTYSTPFCESFKSPPTSLKQTTMEVFIPELVENCAKGRKRREYRFLCPHAGQFTCKLTNLVFEMEGKGEVLYSIVPWDRRILDGLQQNEPAGPLYSINCFEGSICHLHLPHCETRTDVVKLTVAHVTGGNVEIIQPLTVTETHVIISVQGLSLFALIKSFLFQPYPTKAQVLLFYKKRMSKLDIHLLPGNIPVEEVQGHERNMYIKTSSKCQLTHGKNYKLCCETTGHNYLCQPEDETFDCDYGPNYHPTFEVIFTAEVDKVTLSILDENDQMAWRPRMILLTDTEESSTRMDIQGAVFVDNYRDELIQRVSSVMEIVDCLRSKNMISNEINSNIHAQVTPHEQMRLLYRSLDSGGRNVKAAFYKILREKQPDLVDDLESGSSWV